MTDYREYLRTDRLPGPGRAGSGDGIVAKALVRAIERSGTPPDSVRLVCDLPEDRAPTYLALRLRIAAPGEALARAAETIEEDPRARVVVLTGGRELALRSSALLVDAAKRNLDLAVVSIDAPGSGLADLAARAGAVFVARETVAMPLALDRVLERALRKSGFSFVEAVTPERDTEEAAPAAGLESLRSRSVSRSGYGALADEEKRRAIVTGVFVDVARPSGASRG